MLAARRTPHTAASPARFSACRLRCGAPWPTAFSNGLTAEAENESASDGQSAHSLYERAHAHPTPTPSASATASAAPSGMPTPHPRPSRIDGLQLRLHPASLLSSLDPVRNVPRQWRSSQPTVATVAPLGSPQIRQCERCSAAVCSARRSAAMCGSFGNGRRAVAGR